MPFEPYSTFTHPLPLLKGHQSDWIRDHSVGLLFTQLPLKGPLVTHSHTVMQWGLEPQRGYSWGTQFVP